MNKNYFIKIEIKTKKVKCLIINNFLNNKPTADKWLRNQQY